MLLHAHNIQIARLTKDIDFAVMVPDWDTFAALRAALIQGGEFAERAGPGTHRLRHKSGLPLDIVPFGAIERADRTIAWPPDQSTVFDCFGAREALATAVPVLLPQAVRLLVASIPALALLKVTAWNDRKHTHPGRDAEDLLLYLRSYLDCDTLARAAQDHPDLFQVDNYEHEATGARLLGRDMAQLLDKLAVERVLHILQPQADPQGPLLLASHSGHGMEQSRRLIESLCAGLTDTPQGNP